VDPDAALDSLRQLIATLRDKRLDRDVEIAYLYAVVEQAAALDNWLTRGGFLPREWMRREEGT
jgi:hypothetical protein